MTCLTNIAQAGLKLLGSMDPSFNLLKLLQDMQHHSYLEKYLITHVVYC